MPRAAIIATAGVALIAGATSADAQSLRGSPQAMQKQHTIALQHDYTFLRTSTQVRQFVDAGYLVKLPGNADYDLAAVSYPYGRPALKLFVERLASQYRSACGEKLVVTSLTRPVQNQPRNASALSVHPTGMAVDLRVSRNAACRRWIESTLLSLEKQGVLNAIRENYPPHYHVALFTTSYTQYVARLTKGQPSVQFASATSAPSTPARAVAASDPVSARPASGPSAGTEAGPGTVSHDAAPEYAGSGRSEVEVQQYRVNSGDSLWSIARRHGTTVDTLKELNGLSGTAIRAGDVIALPVPVEQDDARS
ncbi:hypothetical protein BH23GEM10_BH23GEM10_12500 [soil metagenome]